MLPTRLLQGASARRCYLLLRLLLVGVFLWSGLSKAGQPGLFAETVGAFGLLPGGLLLPAALALIAAEIVAALGLLFDRRGALAAVTVLLLLFIGVLGYGIVLGLDIDCGCFGPDDPEAVFHDLRGALLRDLLLLAAVIYLYLWRHINRLVPSPWCGGRRSRAITEEA